MTAFVPPAISFSLEGLGDMLSQFRDVGYESVGFPEVAADQPHLVLRHDVDFDLRAALLVAELEASLSIRSTYFIMVRSDCYSVLDAAAQRHIRSIVALGHHVGLHLDATLYSDGDLTSGAAREVEILAWVSGIEPSAISFHRPLPHLIGSGDHGFALPHTYQPQFTDEIAYVSDSQGRFRFGSPFETEAFFGRRAIHLLLHPIWWAGPAPVGAEARLRALVDDRHHSFANRVAKNCLPYREMTA